MVQIYRIFYEQNKFILENFTKLSERIKQIIDYKGISINKFSALVGTSNSYFNKILRDNNSIGSDKIEKILRVFPEISAKWLILGEGGMLKNAPAPEPAPQESHTGADELVTLLRDKIALLEKNNASLEYTISIQEKITTSQEREIQRQQEKITSKDQEIQRLKEKITQLKKEAKSHVFSPAPVG